MIIESDSMAAVKWVNSQSNRPWKLLNTLNHIDILLAEINCFEVRHIFRESNFIADHLAKKGCSSESILWHFVDPM